MISIIVAIDKNNLIGNKNSLPWNYPEDLKYFREITLNKTVLMGKNTFISILNRNNKPLPKRKNIVVSHDKNLKFDFENVEVVNDLEKFLTTNKNEEIFVIGGKQIYEFSLPYASRLYITHINKEYVGDTYFPKIDYEKFHLISNKVAGELNFCIYERKIK